MANQIVVSSGAKVRNLEGVLTGTSGVVNALSINVPNGIPQLDGSGKILVSQLPNSVMEYKGTWNAATNTPTLADGTGNQGDVYLCNVAGTVNFGSGPISFFVGDQVIYSGSIWQRASGASGTVTSVAVTESGDSLTITGSPITTSGTINIGFAGTNLQYINGEGNLTTFPSLTGYVPYTGATTNVNLGTFDLTADIITGATGSFASSGGSNTFDINHSSGSGIALNITKGGNEEGIYINKTSGSGNAATIIGTLNATTLVKSGGTSSQFLKADGSVDSSTYLTTSAASSTYVPYTGATTNVNLGGFGITASSLNVTNTSTLDGNILLKKAGIAVTTSTYVSQFAASSGVGIGYSDGTGGANFILQTAAIYDYTFPAASGTLALTSDLGSYLPLTGGTLTGGLYINPTNTATVGLDVASNTTRFRSDNLEGFKRQLEIVMGSGTLVQCTAKGFGANYGTDLAFYTSASGGVNASPAIYITGGNQIGIKTGTPAYDLDVSGTGRFTGTLLVGGVATFSSSSRGLNFISPSTRSNTIDIGNVTNYPNYNFVGYDGYWGIRTDLSNGFNIDTYNGGTPKNVLTILQGGNVGIGRTNPSNKLDVINSGASQGTSLFATDNATFNSIQVYAAGADGYNGAATVMIVGRNTSTNRSINAGGTLNAVGTDYAEYMTKSTEDIIAKGDIVGVDENGLLTNIFIDSKSFVVKSTNPSFIGGDSWCNVDNIGKITNDSTDKEKEEYQEKIEEARAKVDRIAFSGQVPCNVYNAQVGDYIIPIELNGKISGQAVSNPTFEQYQISVGKVWKIMEDGRAWIAVKIG